MAQFEELLNFHRAQRPLAEVVWSLRKLDNTKLPDHSQLWVAPPPNSYPNNTAQTLVFRKIIRFRDPFGNRVHVRFIRTKKLPRGLSRGPLGTDPFNRSLRPVERHGVAMIGWGAIGCHLSTLSVWWLVFSALYKIAKCDLISRNYSTSVKSAS